MKPYFEQDGVTLYAGDCLDVLPTLEPNSVDAIVTDPPAGIEFMGKAWDNPTTWSDRVGKSEGFRWIGIEREAESCATAAARLAHWGRPKAQPPLPLVVNV